MCVTTKLAIYRDLLYSSSLFLSPKLRSIDILSFELVFLLVQPPISIDRAIVAGYVLKQLNVGE